MQRRKRNTARGIVVHKNAILLLERWRRDTSGKQLHYFSIPGGGIERGETPEVAVVRELFEEASVVVRPQRLIATQMFEDGSQNSYFVCDYLSGEPKLHASAAEEQTPNNRSLPRWITKKELDALPLNVVYEPMRQLLVAAFDKKLPHTPQTIK